MTGGLPWTVLLHAAASSSPGMAFLIGMSWFLCAIGAFTRDAGYLMINIVPLFMFADAGILSRTPRCRRRGTSGSMPTRSPAMSRSCATSCCWASCPTRSSILLDAGHVGLHLLFRLLVLRQVSECHRRRHLRSSSETRHLGKAYQLYAHRNDWLKQVVFGWWKTYFKPFWVLRDIDLEVQRGESDRHPGPQRLRQVHPAAGDLRHDPAQPRRAARHRPHRAGAGARRSTFDLELSGRENVMIGGAVLGLKRAEVLRKFNSIAEFAGIGDYMDQPVKHYSMGMRTRLAFSICAHVEAEILVVDEALAVGDAAFQRKCLDWIDSFRKHGHAALRVALDGRSAPPVHARHLDRGRPHPRPGRSERGHPRLPSGAGQWRRTTSIASRRASDGRWPHASSSGSGLGWWAAAIGRAVGECGAGAAGAGRPTRCGTARPISASWRRWTALRDASPAYVAAPRRPVAGRRRGPDLREPPSMTRRRRPRPAPNGPTRRSWSAATTPSIPRSTTCARASRRRAGRSWRCATRAST